MVERTRRRTVERLRAMGRDQGLWLCFGVLALATILHYAGSNPLRGLLLSASLELTPCVTERLLFLLPVALAAVRYGAAAGWLTIAVSALIMLPRAVTASCRPESAMLETVGVLAVAVFLNWALSRQQAERQAREEEQHVYLERLHGSERRYRGLFENASDAIWVQDNEGRLAEANAACARLTGYDLDELVGQPAGRFLRHPLTTGRRELPLRRKDGSEVVIELMATPIPGNGDTAGWQCIARDVTERRRREDAIRFFARQVLRAQEEERHRIARELHDSTVQTLTALFQHLEALVLDREALPPEPVQRIYRMEHIVSDAIEEVRRFSRNLRPSALEAVGLQASLEEMAGEIQRERGITVEVRALGKVRRLAPEVELALFRIVQEALTNVGRHAYASEVIVTLWYKKDMVRAAIRDDGRGARLPDHLSDLLAAGQMGLAGIQERARLLGGAANIRSEPSRGTTVNVEIPV